MGENKGRTFPGGNSSVSFRRISLRWLAQSISQRLISRGGLYDASEPYFSFYAQNDLINETMVENLCAFVMPGQRRNWQLILLSCSLSLIASGDTAYAADVLFSAPGGSAWLNGANWTGGSIPANGDVAQFGANPTGSGGVGINFANPTNAGTQTNGQRIEEAGAIEITSARSGVNNMSIGNNSSTAGATGTLRLLGATVNGTSNVILRNNSNRSLTIRDTQGSGTQTMSLALGNAINNVILIDGSGDITISSVIKDAAGSKLTIGGIGTGLVNIITSGTNTYSGGTTISQGSVVWNNADSFGTGGVTINDSNTLGDVTLAKNANGNLSSNITVANAGTGTAFIGSSTAGSAVTVNYNGSLTLDKSATLRSGNGALVTFQGAVSGTGGVTVSGTGTVRLTNSNSYQGNTTVNVGTLQVNNTTGSGTGTGNVVVNNDGTLSGTGSIAGSVTLNSTAHLAPGTGIESLEIGTSLANSLTFSGTSNFDYDINSSGTPAADLIDVKGSVTIGANANLNVTDLAGMSPVALSNVTFTLISYTGTLTGTFASQPEGSIVTVGPNAFTLRYADTSGGTNFGGGTGSKFVTLSISAVPEANVFVFGMIGCSLVGLVFAGRKFLSRKSAA
jgi:autotransporter-associated beta strand protein